VRAWRSGGGRLQTQHTRQSSTPACLQHVDTPAALLACALARSLQQAQAANGSSSLLPPFLQFNTQNKRSPVDERMPNDPFLRSFMATGQDML
jgi:hypothetical protein